ncbi:hypothetical protein BS17DRAFT_767896 [Gyrodon lividus]|nr:hypothetical protein BS17DRAFT_767896 [Gyrodon lividus]
MAPADITEKWFFCKPRPERIIPKGWTEKIIQESNVEEMIGEATGLKVDKVELAEIAGCRYIFSSGELQYIWNCSNEEGAVFKSPRGRGALFAQLAANPLSSNSPDVVLEPLVLPD